MSDIVGVAQLDTAALRAKVNDDGPIIGLRSDVRALCDALDASEAIRKSYIELNNDLDSALDAARAENADLLAGRANDDRDYRALKAEIARLTKENEDVVRDHATFLRAHVAERDRMRPVVEAAVALDAEMWPTMTPKFTPEILVASNRLKQAVAAYQAGEKP